MKTILRIIDSISDRTGEIASWLAVVLVLLITQEVIMRFVFNAPSMWAFESSMMVGTSLYVLGWSYVLRHRAHVRVDVIYSLLPRRMKALIDVLGTLIMFFPLFIAITYSAFNWTVYSWAINEKMTETYWLPPIAPLRTVVLLAIIILLLQGVAHFIRDSYLLVKDKPYD